jgi:hypothetical protein
MTTNSIYNTPECDSWARQWDYPAYLDYCELIGHKSRLLSEKAYKLFCDMMVLEMMGDFKSIPNEEDIFS